jgi:hypothetical protein
MDELIPLILRFIERSRRVSGEWKIPMADLVFWCPGCKQGHAVYLSEKNDRGAIWQWDGDKDKPTFTPSFLHDIHKPRCHCVVTKGMIHFCSDCDHALANQVVPMELF